MYDRINQLRLAWDHFVRFSGQSREALWQRERSRNGSTRSMPQLEGTKAEGGRPQSGERPRGTPPEEARERAQGRSGSLLLSAVEDTRGRVKCKRVRLSA
jgi:hypothetical protein